MRFVCALTVRKTIKSRGAQRPCPAVFSGRTRGQGGQWAIAVAQAIAEQPTASKAEIGKQIGITGQRVGQIENEMKAKSEPKLLKHGGKVTDQVGNNQVASKGGMTAPYILARLKRDGFEDLAQQVKDRCASRLKISPMGFSRNTDSPGRKLPAPSRL